MLVIGLLYTAIFATIARAQTKQQLQDCQFSITTEYDEFPVWSTTDNTHYFNMTYTYNATACTTPSQVPVSKFQLYDINNNVGYKCPTRQFDSSGILYLQCTQTLGLLATKAQEAQDRGDRDPDDDYFSSIGVGAPPSFFTLDKYFQVQYYTPPTPSGGIARRRIDKRHQCDIPGFNYCRTSSKSYGCIDTSSSLDSCGACPDSEDSIDCTAIDGADRVECRSSQCFVHTCLRGYQVSTDRKSCVPVTKLALQPRQRRK